MNHRLTKTAYLNYLKCPNEFWLDHHRPAEDSEAGHDLEYEHLRQQGYAVQQLVRSLGRFQPAADLSVDLERAFTTDRFYARSDITVTDRTTGVVDLYEIKSSSSVKEEHLDDVAFQRMVAELAGSPVGRCYLITMNAEYVRQGDIDPEAIFVVTDVTDEAVSRAERTRQQADEALAFLDSIPVPSLIDYCDENKLDCRFIRENFTDLPDYTVFDIARLNNVKRRALLTDGVIDIRDVPPEFELTAKQLDQIAVARSGEPLIKRDAILSRIDGWEYPLHFLDYETFSYAIPQFDGIRPFQQMCFQYSLHTIDRPGAEVEHRHFLSRGEDDPPLALSERLSEDLAGRMGTVFVWYEPFEKGRNTEMAAMYPQYASFYEELNSHIVDLMKVFSDGLYIHPDFKGKTSIKKVLPVLRPALSYKELGIGDGMTASISWFRAATWTTLDQPERERIFEDLERYCEMDTRAMVEIFEELVSVSAESIGNSVIGLPFDRLRF